MNTKSSHFLSGARDWFWPLALATTVFMVSGRSQVSAPNIVGIDKIAHFFVFGLLATLVARVPVVATWRGLGLYWAVVLTACYGISDEFHQSFTPGRSVELADWLVDTAGAMLAVTLYARWRFYRGALELPLARSRIETPTPAERIFSP
ncbi:MAG: VanZ family protein [Nibricoccus sp.]